MSKKLFQQVESYAESMLAAAEINDEAEFYGLYDALLALCEENKGSKQEHPVLWETLADFTEDNSKAISFYQLAYEQADSLKENEYKASIQYSLAVRLLEESDVDNALFALEKAEKFAGFTEDEELKLDISELKKKVPQSA